MSNQFKLNLVSAFVVCSGLSACVNAPLPETPEYRISNQGDLPEYCPVVKGESSDIILVTDFPDPMRNVPERNVVNIFGEISNSDSDVFYHMNNFMQSEGLKYLVSINTQGGDASVAVALHDLWQTNRSQKVNTYVHGEASSAGAMILISGTGKRYAGDGAIISFHSARNSIFSPDMNPNHKEYKDSVLLLRPEALESNQNSLAIVNSALEKMLVNSSNGRVDENCARFLLTDIGMIHLTANQALRLGFVDYVVQPGGKALTLKTAAPAPTPQ